MFKLENIADPPRILGIVHLLFEYVIEERKMDIKIAYFKLRI